MASLNAVSTTTASLRKRWHYRLIGVPITTLFLLSALLAFTASLLVIPEPEWSSKLPILMTIREIDGTFFSKHNFRKAPTLYGWFHVIPSLFWSAAMPTQHVKSFRTKYINVHRWIGRALITVSLLLAITGSYFCFAGLTTTADLWHVHTLKFGKDPHAALPYLVWPSVRMWAIFYGPLFGTSAWMTYYYARKGDIVSHQRWAEIMTYAGYVIPMERVMICFNFLVGVTLEQLPAEWRSNLRVPTTLPSKHEAEKAAFSFTAWSSTILILTYVTVKIRRQQFVAAAASVSAKSK